MIIQNKLSAHKTTDDKNHAYNAAILSSDKKAMAYRSNGTTVPLVHVNRSDVEFIGGLWRVQDDFPYKIQLIRDREMVLLKKLPHQERMPFEYFTACIVGYNCYGPFIHKTPDCIVAKYTTDDGVFWGYGATIEKARAFLGIKLYDTYMDLIHKHACKSQFQDHQK